jgi:tetratricopeptide (TPR) repeat protein
MDTQELIAEIRRHVNDIGQQLPPPATPEEIAEAEAKIGFPLPPLLKALYSELANGGFGPHYGFGRLFDYSDKRPAHRREGVIDLYLSNREGDFECEMEAAATGSRKQFSWPPMLLPLVDVGCAITICVDCSRPQFPIVRSDPNQNRQFHRESPSMQEWLERWLSEPPAVAQQKPSTHVAPAPKSLVDQGVVHLRDKRIPEAELCFRKATEIAPNFAAGHFWLGELNRVFLKKPQSAENFYKKAIELAPSEFAPLQNLGRLYHEQLGQPDKARECYLCAFALNPNVPSIYILLGRLYAESAGEQREAEACFLKAIELAPKEAPAAYNAPVNRTLAAPHLGLAALYHFRMDRPRDAEAHYRKAIELDPRNARTPELLRTLSREFGETGETGRA